MVAYSLVFALPLWFWAFAGLPLLAIGLWFLSRRIARQRIVRFASAGALPDETLCCAANRRFRKFAVTVIVAMLFAVALARPLTGPKQETDQRRGADLVIVLDVSKSMWVADVPPNRLAAVKQALGDWINHQRLDRIGLVLFAGEAFVQAPLTCDYTALNYVLQEASPEAISKKGTNIPAAIDTATRMLNVNEVESKFVLLVSDGENIEGDAITAAREAYQRDGVHIYTVGVGTGAGGRVQSYDKSKFNRPPPNWPEFVRNEYGAEVVSRLDSQALRAIARVAGGAYYDFKPGEPIFQSIRDKNVSVIVEKMRKIDAKDYDEWFQIPLGLAILILGLEPLFLRRRRVAQSTASGVPVVMPVNLSGKRRAKAIAIAIAATVLALLLPVIPQQAEANTEDIATVEKLLSEDRKAEAVEYMQKSAAGAPEDAYLSYNLGLTLVRAGRAEEAVTIFESVQSLTSDKKLRAQAMLQLGNIHFQIATAAKGGPAAVRAFENALSNYELHLELKLTDAGKKNRDSAAKELEAVLLLIGAERTRANTEKTLREALQVYERATELNARHQPLVDKAKELLAKELARNAAEIDKQADQAEAAKETVSGKQFNGLLEKRESAVGKLQEAVDLQPQSKELKDALEKQKAKMSDLLTRAAEEETKELLGQEKNFYSNNALKALVDAGSKLDQAVSLNPQNGKAEKLNAEVHAALLEAHLSNGELALKHFRKNLPENVQARLNDAMSAAKSFSKALELDPENQRAKDGLGEVQPALADLHATAGENDLKQAEQMLGANGAANKAPENGERSQNSSPVDGASPETLRKAGAQLEKSLNNLNAAVGLDPNNSKYQETAASAEALMGAVRDQLAKQDGKSGEGKGESDPSGESNEPGSSDGEGESKSGDPNGKSSLQSLSGLRGKSKSGGSGGGDTQRYWEKFVRDW